HSLGFTNICTMEDIKEHFPLLDMVDHANRVKVATNGYKEKEFPRVEAIVTFGEPNRWETNLQLLIDLLLTNGYPKIAPEGFPDHHLPILACNMDLVFMAEACMPRFGNGSFLICLESLYKKITGRDLKYSALVGKPSEITFRYAEHCLTNQARRMGITKPIKKLYFFGDNPEVDIVGANLYDRYIKSLRDNGNSETCTTIPINSRKIPEEAEFHDQSVESIDAILVETGVYNPATTNLEENSIYHHGHRDFEKDTKLKMPSKFARDVYDGVVYALQKEGFKCQVTG
ncbi:haloacid dehalogenase-like hydrolase domain-containing 5, partial [Lingula anatina]|uniref:Haloacid dehalogenase-like hydrolase domain-containing 5 n=1 Tax=Lingula anatina TaxID=7574 RepID=A0A1S3K3W2_LINAN